MSKQSERAPGTVTDAEICDLCHIAKIPEASRVIFAADFRAAIAKANRRGADYRSPDGAAPIIAGAKAISAAANKLLDAIEECGAETRSLMQGMLLEGELNDRVQAVHDLFSASDLIADALNNANGRPRNAKGRPSTEVGDPGLPAGDLFAFEAFLYVKHAGGRLSINETNGTWGGNSLPFFSACGPLLPKGVILPASPSRLKDLRAQALGKQRAK
jgi:hypothetical protein